ncbi:hypothetical protein BC939DRAFT_509019 [Gamsiella multidivaricata]|uniref:uncharacterized protein n=1 Tax=Gamsiella multidivaricata TaxID=101098 RepID=UPI0022205B07|nr:uncharacterized protein BC939DRAFT_509019 [Gamsiella multidivaricata]KAI7815735.1 hypothetical protein BC939DRAFT_509019 [Gamsiella multidivaricata]
MPGISKSFNNLATPSLAEIKEHLRIIQNEDSTPALIRNALRYSRIYSDRWLSPPVNGIQAEGAPLGSVRNVVKTKQDVAVLWDCEPEKIKILGLDLGQAFVVGASALLPEKTLDDMKKSVSLEMESHARQL